MCASTATIRFPGAMNTRLINLIAPLVAYPPMRFIQTGEKSFHFCSIFSSVFFYFDIFPVFYHCFINLAVKFFCLKFKKYC